MRAKVYNAYTHEHNSFDYGTKQIFIILCNALFLFKVMNRKQNTQLTVEQYNMFFFILYHENNLNEKTHTHNAVTL